ncbi:hypothetical protein Ddye_003070 [Dipteronia dyeriana]|uniref:RWP-RK domain-containing protein n=1 Tax=Dipteronia dyeriana TaxID=168575 RepID=A0AAE0CV11_9ROSI|nr:hypothetical protein Ddye_003070 [Dipteronia dyeriana]
MGSSLFEIVWPKYEIEEQDLFASLAQLPYPDFSVANGFPTSDWQNGLPLQESCFDGAPSMESFPDPDKSCPSMDVVPSPNLIQGDVCWDEFYSPLFEPEKQPLFLCDGGQITGEEESTEKCHVVKRYREDKRSNTKTLSKSTISSYFYLPITQAAKELDVGLTFLKKRCRELGIRRWPHRKLMSLQTLINNLNDYEREKGGDSRDVKVRESIEILEREMKMMEEIPDMEMEDKTKRLRQACFKFNYKKRKFMGANNMSMDAPQSSTCSSSSGCNSSSSNAATIANNVNETAVEEDGDMKNLCYSLIPPNIMEY